VDRESHIASSPLPITSERARQRKTISQRSGKRRGGGPRRSPAADHIGFAAVVQFCSDQAEKAGYDFLASTIRRREDFGSEHELSARERINHVASNPYFACCIRYRWHRVCCDYFN
jgi:hypothetical protein